MEDITGKRLAAFRMTALFGEVVCRAVVCRAIAGRTAWSHQVVRSVYFSQSSVEDTDLTAD